MDELKKVNINKPMARNMNESMYQAPEPTRRSGFAWIVLVLAVVVAVAGWILVKFDVIALPSSSSSYQAVFLVNGQVYFGKLSGQNNQFPTLTDVYYLQVNQALQPAGGASQQTPDISLVKLGGELHGPTDRMDINRDQILLIEDLKTDSNVVRAIEEYKKNAANPQPAAAAN